MNANKMRRVALVAAVLATTLFGTVHAFNQQDVDRLRATRNCAGCDLSGARLPGLAGARADFTNANLSGAFLYKANLSGASLTGAVLQGANLSSANLSNAVGANLAGAKTDATTVCPNGAAGPCK